MNKKIIKIIPLLFAIILAINTKVFAVAAGWAQNYKPATDAPGVTNITTAGGQIAGIVAAIGVAVALVILIWLGIKYMTASPDGKADVKKSAVPYIIGAVVIFAASGILGIIAGFADGLFSGGGGGDSTPKTVVTDPSGRVVYQPPVSIEE